jgi:hypothetical protein
MDNLKSPRSESFVQVKSDAYHKRCSTKTRRVRGGKHSLRDDRINETEAGHGMRAADTDVEKTHTIRFFIKKEL